MKGSLLPRSAGLFLLLSVLSIGAGSASGQAIEPGGIEGRITDDAGRPARAVIIEVREAGAIPAFRTTQSDEGGYFRIEPLDAGVYEVRFVRLGSEVRSDTVEVPSGGRVPLEVTLVSSAVRLDPLVVGGERSLARARFEDEAGTTTREISGEAIRSLPGLSEGDPLRAVEILPGVVSPTDFSASYNVRGGSADQNLILLDGFPLFNPFHLGGLFSVFNADMIERVSLESGGFAPEFGGRVSSVLEVDTDPGPGELDVRGGISLLAARLAVAGGVRRGLEEPLGLANTRWRISARRSYVDQLLRPITELPYSVTDVQGSFESWHSETNRIAITAYTGRDVLDLGRVSTDDFPLRLFWSWGNDLLGLHWSRVLDDGGRAELRVGGSRFRSHLRFTDFEDSDFGSEIRHLLVRGSVHRYLGGSWRVRSGVDADHFAFRNHAESGGTVLSGGAGDGLGAAPWAHLEWRRPREWIVAGGLRIESWFPGEGPALVIPSPRISAKRFFADGNGAVRASMGRYAQFTQSLRDEEIPLGIDVWVAAGPTVPRLTSDQVQLGVEGFLGDGWFLGADVYHRTFDGVLTMNPASDPNLDGDEIVRGWGRGYGADLFLEKSQGRVTGSLSLSWLKADRRFPDFMSGRVDAPEIAFPPIFDRRLDLDLVLRFPLPRAWDGSARWHLGSALPHTRPLTSYAYFEPRYTQDGRLRWQGSHDANQQDERRAYAVAMGARNGARYPAYHRLDVSVRKTYEPSWGTVTPYLDLLNVYNQSNVLFYFYDFERDPPTRSGLSMFPLLPTFGVEVRF